MKGERIRVREAIGKSGSDGGSITDFWRLNEAVISI